MLYRKGSPLNLEPYKTKNKENKHELREKTNRVFNDTCRLKKSEPSFHIDAARVWNAATSQIRNAPSLGIAKTKINEFCKTLPV